MHPTPDAIRHEQPLQRKFKERARKRQPSIQNDANRSRGICQSFAAPTSAHTAARLPETVLRLLLRVSRWSFAACTPSGTSADRGDRPGQAARSPIGAGGGSWFGNALTGS
ncbi:MAG: hypothetical protein QOC63_4605 [Mycobacterium sp.]|jgi:hypothetical protein|nr:hypothetical protein [Mycobacterium sp.]